MKYPDAVEILDTFNGHILFERELSVAPKSLWNRLLSTLEGRNNANVQGRYGRTPLHFAMAEGNRNAVERLLAMGADLKARDDKGRTPLFYAASLGRADVIKDLLQRGGQLDDEPGTLLVWAANGGHAAVVACLLDAGYDVNAQDAQGDTALHAAAEMGFTNVVHVLLEANADLGIRNRRNDTPLTMAARDGHWGIAATLAEKGASINDKDSLGVTPLHWASIDEVDSLKHSTRLLQLGADPNAKVNGETPADWARRLERRQWDSVIGILAEYAAKGRHSSCEQAREEPSPS